MGRLGLQVGRSFDGMKAGGQRSLGLSLPSLECGVRDLFDGKAGCDLGRSYGLGVRRDNPGPSLDVLQ